LERCSKQHRARCSKTTNHSYFGACRCSAHDEWKQKYRTQQKSCCVECEWSIAHFLRGDSLRNKSGAPEHSAYKKKSICDWNGNAHGGSAG